MYDKGVCRTALATPGPLNSINSKCFEFNYTEAEKINKMLCITVFRSKPKLLWEDQFEMIFL